MENAHYTFSVFSKRNQPSQGSARKQNVFIWIVSDMNGKKSLYNFPVLLL